ncbi:MAG: hypothetical protein PHN47_05230 [Clostridia bacterium]|nr:hypothetical protein [Clostridia bacterium]
MLKTKDQGSALIWTLLVFLILLVILAGAGVTVSSRNSQNLAELAEEQAYITARSGAELIAKEICSGTNQTTIITQHLLDHGYLTVNNADLPESMGDCNILLTLEDTEYVSYQDEYGHWQTKTIAAGIKVLATATYRNKEKSTAVYVEYDGANWAISRYDNK